MEFYYDTCNRCTLVYSYSSETGQEWSYTKKSETVYNDDGTVASVFNSNWNQDDGDWQKSIDWDYRYNPDRSLQTLVAYFYDSLVTQAKSDYVYMENRLIRIMDSVKISENWEEYEKSEFFYDENNNLVREIIYGYFEGWQEKVKWEYAYDTQNRKIMTIYFDRKEDAEILTESRKDSIFYNEDGDITVRKSYLSMDGEMTENYREEYQYNTSYTVENVIYPGFFLRDLDFTHMITEENLFLHDDFLGMDLLMLNTRYFYSPVSMVSVPTLEKPASRISLYPNPASTYVHVHTDLEGDIRCELYDLTGRNVRNTPVSGNVFSVEGIEPGIYVYKLIAGHHVETGKLIIR